MGRQTPVQVTGSYFLVWLQGSLFVLQMRVGPKYWGFPLLRETEPPLGSAVTISTSNVYGLCAWIS